MISCWVGVEMKLTNKHGLPQPFVNYLERRPYSKGGARVSVTELCSAPQVSILTQRHWKDMEEDVMDCLWSLFGTAVHDVLATGSDHEHVTEEDLFLKVNGWEVKGGIDLQKVSENTVVIQDYKVTKSYPVMIAMKEGKPDWERQLNCYAHLIREVKGYDVAALEVWAIVKDHDRRRAERDRFYPQQPMVRVSIPLWTPQEAQQYMEERVKLHRDAWALGEIDADLPPCTDEERWKRPDKWAVFRNSKNKRATAVLPTEDEAKAHVDLFFNEKDDPRIEHRPGRYVKCEEFCDVSKWCAQWNNDKSYGGELRHGNISTRIRP